MTVCGYVPSTNGLAALLVATPAATPAKIELGLHRPGVSALAGLLATSAVERRRDVVSVEPVVQVVIRHHGRAERPRDAAFVSLAT